MGREKDGGNLGTRPPSNVERTGLTSSESPLVHVPYTEAAGGVSGVTTAVKYALREAGVVRATLTLAKVNQLSGFDCPSCAWPDPAHRAVAEFCENGAKAVADEATKKRVDPAFFAAHSIEELSEWSDMALNRQGRLTHPMVKVPNGTHYEPISWDGAYQLLGSALLALDSPDEALFYTSGRASNEVAFLYQLFARMFGTNNLPDCSNMCHESSGVGMRETLGTGKGTVSLEDFEHADAVFVIGQNPGTNHPRMLSTLRACALRGCKIVSINPMREVGLARFSHPQTLDVCGKGVALANLTLQVKIGGDLALLQGIQKVMLEREVREGGIIDHPFVAQHTDGYADHRARILSLDWHELEESSGLTQEQFAVAADIACTSKRTIVTWAMGITQHTFGVKNVREIVNFLLLRGNMGRLGAGACPVRGHSNVQGDRTMGIWEHVPAWIENLERRFSFTAPRKSGLDVVASIGAMASGQAKILLALGGNLLSASPDTEVTAAAMQRCRVTAHIATKLNRSHLTTGQTALILPCLGRTERDMYEGKPRFVTVENSMSVVSKSEGVLAPLSLEMRSEVEIVCGIAKATLGDPMGQWDTFSGDYHAIREAIGDVVPGFSDFRERIRDGSFVLPNPASTRSFETASQRAAFTSNPLPVPLIDPDDSTGQLLMMTIRTHDQFNTTVYDVDDRYRGIYGHRRVILMHEADAAARGLREGDEVTITSHVRAAGEVPASTRTCRSFVVVIHDIARGCTATYFPESNPLVHLDSHDPQSRTPASKSVVITLQKERGTLG